MEFDREYIDQEIFVQRRLRRDAVLRDHDVDPEAFHVWGRQQEVDNEAGTDEYRETQPGKGLHMIAELLDDWFAGPTATMNVIRLTAVWLEAAYQGFLEGHSYAGAEELAPILEICFDYMWELGGYSLYSEIDSLPDEDTINYYKEDHGTN